MSALREFCLKYLLRKEEDEMAVVYATLIIKGKKTIDQVPARLRKQVEEILEACEVEICPPAAGAGRSDRLPFYMNAIWMPLAMQLPGSPAKSESKPRNC